MKTENVLKIILLLNQSIIFTDIDGADEMEIFDSYIIKSIMSHPFRTRFSDNDPVFSDIQNPYMVIKGVQNIKLYKIIIEDIWSHDREIRRTVSEETVEENVMQLLYKTKVDAHKPQANDINNILTFLSKLKPIEYRVFRSIYGLNIESDEPYILGNYHFYQLTKHKKELKESIGHYFRDSLINRFGSDTIISTIVIARDNGGAIQQAEYEFEKFENIFTYMRFTDIPSYEAEMLELSNKAKPISVAVSDIPGFEERTRLGKNRRGYNVSIDDLYFIEESNGYDRIWNLTKNPKISQIERRILNAVEWVGKGIKDRDSTKMLLQLTFAIESLFVFAKKGVLVSPSIASQLSEASAFVAYTDKKERIKTEKFIKKIYEVRSSIVHGRATDIKDSDIYQLFILIKKIISNLLTSHEYSKFTSIEQLYEQINELKYT